MTTSEIWDERAAAAYDAVAAEMFRPEVLDPVVDRLAALAGNGPALEFAMGTGRVALPLLARGVPVTGIESSSAMVAQLRAKVDEQALPAIVGDMATTRVPGEFALVYLVWNSIANLRTQARRSSASAMPPDTCAPAAGSSSNCGCHPSAGFRRARRRYRSPSTATT